MQPADRNRATCADVLTHSHGGSASFFGFYTEAYREFGL